MGEVDSGGGQPVGWSMLLAGEGVHPTPQPGKSPHPGSPGPWRDWLGRQRDSGTGDHNLQ